MELAISVRDAQDELMKLLSVNRADVSCSSTQGTVERMTNKFARRP